MKFLVTGGAGFIGSNLVDLLLEKDKANEVVVWDSFSTGLTLNLVDAARTKRLRTYQLDVADATVNSGINETFDVIFHLAAESRIQPSFDNIQLTYRSNVLGAASVVQYAKDTGCKRIVSVSSSTVDDDVSKNPYAMTKHQGEELMAMASHLYGISTVSIRPYNVYGRRHLASGPYSTVIAIFEQQTKDGKKLSITGDGEQRRDFTHVNDIVEGLWHVSQDIYNGEVFGLGTGINYSINEVAEMFQPGKERIWLPARPGEAKHSLAKRVPDGWTAKTDLESYVQSFVDVNS